MTLQEIINLKVGAFFYYKGRDARVLWTEYLREEVGETTDSKGNKTKLYSNFFGMAFDIGEEVVTIRSMFPYPDKIILGEFKK